MLKRKTILVVNFLDLPPDVKEELRDWHLFGNDRMLELITSYRLGDGPQTPENMLKLENFEALYQLSVKEDGFTGTLDDFLGAYNLRALHWVASQKPNLADIDQVVVDVSW